MASEQATASVPVSARQIIDPSIENLFTFKPSDETFVNSRYLQIRPNNAISETSRRISFTLPKTEGTVLYDFADIFMNCRVKIVKKDNSNVDSNVHANFVNNTLFSLFSNLVVHANETRVLFVQNFNYVQYLRTVLGYSKTAKKTFLFTISYDEKIIFYEKKSGNPGISNETT